MFDPFEILGLPRSFFLDMKVLEKRYFEEQKKVHPDRFALEESAEKARALRSSTHLNQAYLLLKDPLQRAGYLLKAASIHPLSHDPETLTKVMDWNERLEEGDNVSQELAKEEDFLFNELEDAFKSNEYEKANIALYRITYVKKLLKDVYAKAKGRGAI